MAAASLHGSDRFGRYALVEDRATAEGRRCLGNAEGRTVQLLVLDIEPTRRTEADRVLGAAAEGVAFQGGEHVLRLLGVEREGDARALVSEHVEGRWLADVLVRSGPPPHDLAAR